MICYPETASGSDISLDSRTIITNILEVIYFIEKKTNNLCLLLEYNFDYHLCIFRIQINGLLECLG